MKFNYQFVGTYHAFSTGLGGFLQSIRRTKQKPAQQDQCVFCPKLESDASEVELFQWAGELYGSFLNANPIVRGQLLTVPLGLPCRLGLKESDVELMLRLTAHGLEGLPSLKCRPSALGNSSSKQRVVWANPLPGASRSVPHLHLNSIEHGAVPEAELTTSEFIMYGVGEAAIHRVDASCYIAIEIVGPNDRDRALTAACLHQWCNQNRVAYNIISSPGEAGVSRLFFVPRSLEFSPTIRQPLAGLEFYSLCCIPPRELWDEMGPEKRDAGFRESTLSESGFASFCGELRSGLQLGPRAAVVAIRPK